MHEDREAQLPIFRLDERDLGMGASYGNAAVWINTKNTGAIERIFSIGWGGNLFGSVATRYGTRGSRLYESVAGSSEDSYVGLRPDGSGRTFELHPAFQRVSMTFGGVIDVRETTFVPLGMHASESEEPPIVYRTIEVTNRARESRYLRLAVTARLRGGTEPNVRARYDAEIAGLVANNTSDSRGTRFLTLDVPSRYGTTSDFELASDLRYLPALDNRVEAVGDVLGCLQVDFIVEPGARKQYCVKMGAFPETEVEAHGRFAAALSGSEALEQTLNHLQDCLRNGQVLTPDRVINEGVLWSKVNMRRVMASYPHGRAFTNDPGVSSNVVVRDSAWFVYGCDFFLPDFSRALLDKATILQYESGKLPEYFDALTGRVEDDGLNINDDTPLYILAVNHHFRATVDFDWLKKIYPSISRAARYIISQKDSRGLVFCSANDSRGSVWAIASWRNIISDYSINGAVTEVNAECVAALRDAAHLAQEAGYDSDAEVFSAASAALLEAMTQHLVNPANGLFYLNIDTAGTTHTDVTGDQIFPVLFRACDDEMAYRIMSRLEGPDFWTEAGLRTASRNDPLYDPAAYSGLIGGVWPGLTWWFAFASSRYHPEAMVRALRSSFEHYGADARKNNTVPGQFSEWFDGESLANRGMRLSPWEPPRFLWAAIEGVCGLTLQGATQPRVDPLVPEPWMWFGIRRLLHGGSYFSYVVVREESGMRVHSTLPLGSSSPVELYERDVSDLVEVFADSCAIIALARNGTTIVVVGNVAATTSNVGINLSALCEPHRNYSIRIFSSERRTWFEAGARSADELKALAFTIELAGYRLVELSQVIVES